jgi:hypothetical protein
MSSFATAGGATIKSIQRGSASLTLGVDGAAVSTTAAINAVDVDKSFISSSCSDGYWTANYFSTSYAMWSTNITVAAVMTSSTLLTFHANGYGYYPVLATGDNWAQVYTPTAAPTIYWEVIEYA